MSDGPNAIGIASIEVTGLNQVTVTHRVKAVATAVVWLVHNSTNSDVTVCVTNFRPKDSKEKGYFQATFLTPRDKCTENLRPDHTGVIAAQFDGNSGQILLYDVTIDGVTAADPELEI